MRLRITLKRNSTRRRRTVTIEGVYEVYEGSSLELKATGFDKFWPLSYPENEWERIELLPDPPTKRRRKHAQSDPFCAKDGRQLF